MYNDRNDALPCDARREGLQKLALAATRGANDVQLRPINKASDELREAFKAFVEKACQLLEYRIHLLLLDPFPPGKRDPNGIHAAIWEEVEDEPFRLPADKPLTMVAYESALTTWAYIEPVAVGDRLPDMPVFLEPDFYVDLPLEATYSAAWESVPKRWRRVIEGDPAG